MFRRPRFKPHLRVEVVPGEGVFLLPNGTRRSCRAGSTNWWRPVSTAARSRRSVTGCAGQATPAQVFYALAQLERRAT